MSYGPSVPDMYCQLALYTGLVLKGEKPRAPPAICKPSRAACSG